MLYMNGAKDSISDKKITNNGAESSDREGKHFSLLKHCNKFFHTFQLQCTNYNN